jgi:hypothetical protein
MWYGESILKKLHWVRAMLDAEGGNADQARGILRAEVSKLHSGGPSPEILLDLFELAALIHDDANAALLKQRMIAEQLSDVEVITNELRRKRKVMSVCKS